MAKNRKADGVGEPAYETIGTGKGREMSKALQTHMDAKENSKLRALITSDSVKATRLSEKYDVPHTPHLDFDLCLKSGEIGTVCIVLPD
jgi:hypothetical protein